MASCGGGGGVTIPFIVDKFMKKLQMQSKCYETGKLLKQFSKLLSALGGCHVTIIGGVVYMKSMIFEGFWKYLNDFWYFFTKSFFIARSYPVLVINIKSLIICVLCTVKTRLKVLILAVFWRFWAFSEPFLLAQAFSLGHWFFTKN